MYELSDNNAATMKPPLPSALERFEQARIELVQTPLSSTDNMDRYLPFLNPATFAYLMATPGRAWVDLLVADKILPVIPTLLQLRRTLAAIINLGGHCSTMAVVRGIWGV